jgi:hypothetical protein
LSSGYPGLPALLEQLVQQGEVDQLAELWLLLEDADLMSVLSAHKQG